MNLPVGHITFSMLKTMLEVGFESTIPIVKQWSWPIAVEQECATYFSGANQSSQSMLFLRTNAIQNNGQ